MFKKNWFTNKGIKLWEPNNGDTYIWLDFADGDTLTLRDGSWIVEIVDKIQGVVWNTTAENKQYGLGSYNGLSMAICDGVDDQMFTVGTFDLPGSGYYQVLVIARPVDVEAVNQTMISSNAAAGNQWRIEAFNATQFDGRFRITGGGADLSYNQNDVTTWSLWGMRGAVASRQAFYNASETDTKTPVPELGYDDVYLNLTADAGGFNRLTCELGEILIYSIEEDQRLYEGYAAWKWGLESELPADHPYKNSPPTTESKAAWTPAEEVPTYGGWYDAADTGTITESSPNKAQTIDDKFGNGNELNNFTNTEPDTGTRTLNSLNVLDFDRSNQEAMRSASDRDFGTSGNHIAIGVFASDLITHDQESYWTCDGNNDYQFNANQATYFQGEINATNITNAASSLGVKDGPSIYCVVFDWDNNRMKIFIDGEIAADTGGYTVMRDQLLDVEVMVNRGNNQFLDGYMAEFLWNADDISHQYRERVEGYMAHKWGLTANLPTGHPYKTKAPTV